MDRQSFQIQNLPAPDPKGWDDLSSILSQAWLLFFLGLLGLFTVATHLCQVLHLPFEVLSLGLFVILCGWGILIGFVLRQRLRQNATKDYSALWVLLGFGLLFGILALGLFREDQDDLYYLPNAIFYARNPQEPMTYDVRYLVDGARPIKSLFFCVSIPFEYAHGALSVLTGRPVLELYYLLTPFFMGFSFVMPVYLFLRLLVPEKDQALYAAFSAGLVLLIFFLAGETHRSFGNFLFNRAFQGKTLFLAVILPFYGCLIIRYLSRPQVRYWVALVLVSIAALGATTSALVLLMALMAVVAPAFYLAFHFQKKNFRHSLKRAFPRYLAAGLSLGYFPVFALAVISHAQNNIGSDSPANRGFPTDFTGQLQFFTNPSLPLSGGLIVFTIVALLVLKGRMRNFLLLWSLLLLVVFVNPWACGFLIEHVTAQNIYWRLFYLFPVSFVPAWCLFGIMHLLTLGAGREPVVAVGVLSALLLLLANVLLPFSGFNYVGTRWVWPPELKLGRGFNQAAQASRFVPSGNLLAPQKVSGYFPLIRPDLPQMMSRAAAEFGWLHADGRVGNAYLRLSASRTLQEPQRLDEPKHREEFRQLLQREGQYIDHILAVEGLLQYPKFLQLLRDAGFTTLRKRGRVLLFSKKDLENPESPSP
jgi:hypothetical protein